MFNEYDVVRLKQDKPVDGLTTRHVGTIVMVYDANPPAYEVEFSEVDGMSLLALVTLLEDEIVLALGRPDTP